MIVLVYYLACRCTDSQSLRGCCHLWGIRRTVAKNQWAVSSVRSVHVRRYLQDSFPRLRNLLQEHRRHRQLRSWSRCFHRQNHRCFLRCPMNSHCFQRSNHPRCCYRNSSICRVPPPRWRSAEPRVSSPTLVWRSNSRSSWTLLHPLDLSPRRCPPFSSALRSLSVDPIKTIFDKIKIVKFLEKHNDESRSMSILYYPIYIFFIELPTICVVNSPVPALACAAVRSWSVPFSVVDSAVEPSV